MLLRDQDRTTWDRTLIDEGHALVRECLRRDEPGDYQLQAAINAVHADAPSYQETDWRQIVALYDLLLEQDGSPIVALNRAVAVAQVEGPRAGLAVLDGIRNRAALEHYHLFHAVAGQLWLEAGEPGRATTCFGRALELVELPAERKLLEQRLGQCRPRGGT